MRIFILFILTVLLAGEATAETRYTEAVTLHDYHPFRAVESAEAWDARQKEIRLRTQLACGLYPFPEKTPLNAKRFGAVEGDGFTVERVYFESFPGHYVTGSLFTPSGETEKLGLVDGKRPAFLCPHGHWEDGRLYDAQEASGHKSVKYQIANGGERFEAAARNPIVARCVQLARMGCVAFAYDMLGGGDSIQFVEHRRGPRPGMNGTKPGEFGFVSPAATLRLQTNFGLQSWNSVRALDYLLTLDGIDETRLGVTGASGGGTQTMISAAIDDRIDAAFPCVMPSTAMQGGCTCENTHYLRIGQGNMDLAAALAPKPLGMTAADDWTIELETKGHPDLVDLYKKLNAPKNYEAHFDIHFKHNYNHVSRSNLYSFVNRHFKIGLEEPVLERDFKHLGRKELAIWSVAVAGEPKPEGYLVGDEHEKMLNQVWANDSAKTLDAAMKKGDLTWLSDAWSTILRADDVRDTKATFEMGDKSAGEGVVTMDGTVTGSSSPFAASFSHPSDWNGEVYIVLGDKPAQAEGKASVVNPSLYGQNDEKARNTPMTYSGKKDVAADSWQRSPVYFYGYNDSVFVRRVHDLVSTVAMIRQHPKWEAKKVAVKADGPLSAVAYAAKFILGDQIDELDVDSGDFSFSKVSDNWSDDMVPGAVKYGDIAALRALAGE